MRTGFVLTTWLCLALGVAFGQQVPAPPPDEIFYNGKVITGDSGLLVQEAFAVKGEQFLAVGSNAQVRALAGPQTRLTDLRRHAVIPGLMDNHNHQYNTALVQERGADMTGVRSVAEMQNRLRQEMAKAKPGETVFANAKWTEAELAEKRPPTRQELDQVSADRPIVVYRGRGSAFLNSAALKAAGITRETKTVAGTAIPKDANGEPTGALNTPGTVNTTIRKFAAPPPPADVEKWILESQAQQNARGLTSIRELELPPDAMRAYYRLWEKKKLTMRVSMGLDVVATEFDQLEEILKPWGVGPGFGDHWLRLDCVAEFAVDSGLPVALFREPKVDPPGQLGAMRITPEQLRRAMLVINRYGWRPSIHITGDRTLDHVLDAYEAADAESPIREKRWIVEHIPFVHPDQMERMARLGVLVSAQFQPYGDADGMKRVLGERRADRAVPMRELLDHKVVVSTGSDWPAATNNPFVNVYFYVTRKTAEGSVSGAAQKISREEALRVATANNAYMTFEEDAKGSITPGKLADFLILSQDILTVPEEQIPSTQPLATFVGGRKVFASKDGGF